MSPVMNPFHWNIIILLFCAVSEIDIREKYFSVDSLKLFKAVSSDIIFSSIQDINFKISRTLQKVLQLGRCCFSSNFALEIDGF